jgi:hypothetical protein
MGNSGSTPNDSTDGKEQRVGAEKEKEKEKEVASSPTLPLATFINFVNPFDKNESVLWTKRKHGSNTTDEEDVQTPFPFYIHIPAASRTHEKSIVAKVIAALVSPTSTTLPVTSYDKELIKYLNNAEMNETTLQSTYNDLKIPTEKVFFDILVDAKVRHDKTERIPTEVQARTSTMLQANTEYLPVKPLRYRGKSSSTEDLQYEICGVDLTASYKTVKNSISQALETFRAKENTYMHDIAEYLRPLPIVKEALHQLVHWTFKYNGFKDISSRRANAETLKYAALAKLVMYKEAGTGVLNTQIQDQKLVQGLVTTSTEFKIDEYRKKLEEFRQDMRTRYLSIGKSKHNNTSKMQALIIAGSLATIMGTAYAAKRGFKYGRREWRAYQVRNEQAMKQMKHDLRNILSRLRSSLKQQYTQKDMALSDRIEDLKEALIEMVDDLAVVAKLSEELDSVSQGQLRILNSVISQTTADTAKSLPN